MIGLRLIPALGLLFVASCGGESETASPAGGAPGEKIFAQDCSLCHIAAAPGTRAAKLPRPGPNLYGVYGQTAGQGDFAYSKAMKNAGLIWDEPTLHAFITNPQKLIPGTRMSFACENDPAKRQAIIDYLKTLQ